MYFLPKFLSKVIKKDGFILISHQNQKFIIGNPKKNKPLEVNVSKNVSEIKCVMHSEKWIPEYIISKDITFSSGSLEDFLTILLDNKGRGNVNFFNNFISQTKSIYRRLMSFDSRKRNKESIGFHYDIPSQVYKYMLGESMMYSCAYWDKGGPEYQTLDDAQYEKINFLKKKLRLTDEDSLLDIGCGNGTFILKCAEEHNIPMHGVSLSEEQTKVAKEKQKEKNLGNADITFEVKDFKDIKDKTYSKIISIGQFEHQDSRNYNKYFKKINSLLKENGIAVIHYIGSNTAPKPANEFIQRYIFPFGRCPSFSEVMPEIEKAGLILSDIDVWRKHYYYTLLEWHKNFMNKKVEITKLMGEKFTRIYRIYLWGCAQAFLNDLQVMQLTLTKKIDTAPITKKYLFN
tara:strand:+ start:786 stop:1991 length:1206 start_codon:yes stop_codon:yes gene_type:complete